jgi:NAD(P)-dependent dehydrogenase (short-subunit alcohol dehydrogenase family)
VGKETARILYSKNAKVYLAARSEEKTRKAIEDIKAAVPDNKKGQLVFLRLDLADLTAVKDSAREFLSKERELHLLFNNAGLGYPPAGSKTVQGYELQLGVNCVGPFLFTKLLTPILKSTAAVSPANSVRVVWVSSSASEGISSKGYMENLDYHNDKSSYHKYCVSKMGNYFHATEFAARHKDDGIVSVALNPGNLDSEFWRTQGSLMSFLLRHTVLHPPVLGAYTELYAGLAPTVTLEESGSFGK